MEPKPILQIYLATLPSRRWHSNGATTPIEERSIDYTFSDNEMWC